MHHLPAGRSLSARLSGAFRRAVRLLVPRPRRALPLLVLGVVLAVLGIAAPVVSEAGTGAGASAGPAPRGSTPQGSTPQGSATALRDAGIQMGVDGVQPDASSSARRPGTTAGRGSRTPGGSAPVGTTGTGTTTSGTTTTTAAGTPAGTAAASTPGTATAGSPTGVPNATTGSPTATTAGSSEILAAATSTATSPATSTATSPAPASDAAAASPSPAVAVVPGVTDAVLTALNAARAGAGCAALVPDAGLTGLAQTHSGEMAGSGVLGLSGLAGNTAVVARGPADAASAVAFWLADPAAGKELLDCARTSLGAGEATGAGGPWWTAVVA